MELLVLALLCLHILKTEAVGPMEPVINVCTCKIMNISCAALQGFSTTTKVIFGASCPSWPAVYLQKGVCPQERENSRVKVKSNERPGTLVEAHKSRVGHWCYRSQKCEQPQCEGPLQWHQINAACKGTRQSPVNIVTRNVLYDKSLKPLTFEGYGVKGSKQWVLENNGHTVKVALDTTPKVGGGGLGRKYKAVEFHLHWGVPGEPQRMPGSEHSIDGEKYPMELHIVHMREDVSDMTEAKKTPDGLAVLAFFVKADEENKNYASLLSELENIKYKGQTAQVDPLPLSSLLPPEEDLGRYYRYEGSLTSPDCYEGVIWTVFEKPVELSLSQLSQFAALHFEGNNSTPMVENFRPAQPLNGRRVLWSGSSTALPTAKLLLLPLALTCTLSSLSH